MTATYKLLPYLLSVSPRSPKGCTTSTVLDKLFFDFKTFWAMLEIVPINIEGWHVVISPISVVTSIKSMVYTCLSDESVLVGDLPNTKKSPARAVV
jgi:hypothetical protein